MPFIIRNGITHLYLLLHPREGEGDILLVFAIRSYNAGVFVCIGVGILRPRYYKYL